MRKTRILYITPEVPYFPGGHGGNIREYNLVRRLTDDFEYSLIALKPAPKEHVERLEDLGVNVLFEPSGIINIDKKLAKQPVVGFVYRLFRFLWRRIMLMNAKRYHPWSRSFLERFMKFRKNIRLNNYDLIHVEHTYLLPIVEYLKKQPMCPPILLTAQNIETILTQRLTEALRPSIEKDNMKLLSRQMSNMEAKLMKLPDCIITMSSEDKEWLVQNQGIAEDSAVVIPNGVDFEYFDSLAATPEDYRLTFTGTFDYEPNYEGVIWFRRNVLPALIESQPKVHFHIAGRYTGKNNEFTKLAFPSNESCSFNVPDIRPHINSTAIYVVPLWAGSGTRLKILEAMACGCPVVSTSVGAEGIPAKNGELILISDTPEGMIRHILTLLADHELRSKMGQDAKKWVKDNYDWSLVARRQAGIYEKFRQCSSHNLQAVNI